MVKFEFIKIFKVSLLFVELIFMKVLQDSLLVVGLCEDLYNKIYVNIELII